MGQDPIVTEVRQAREAHAAQFNFDLQAIYRALKEQEEQSQRKKISFDPKRIPPVETEMKPALTTQDWQVGAASKKYLFLPVSADCGRMRPT